MILNLSFILFVIVILGGYIEDRPIISHIDGKKSHYLSLLSITQLSRQL